MNIFGKEINNRYAIWILLNVLIVIDLIAITIEIFFQLPPDIAFKFHVFDFIVCIILLVQWFWTFYISKPKKIFLKQKSNWIDLIASIPFDVILPVVIPQISFLRFLRLLRLVRVIALFNRLFNSLEKFIKKTNLDLIFGGVIFTVIIFTLILNIYGPSYNLFDDFYLVIVTLATVGYGDVVPITFNEKIITIVLIFVGIFIFSTITAAISSFFTDRLINDGGVRKDLKNVKKDLENLQTQNDELKQEIKELKDLMKKDLK